MTQYLFSGKAFKLWKEDAVGVLEFDYQGEKINKLSELSIRELEQVLLSLKSDLKGIRCLLLRSAKEKSFIVGADLTLVRSMKEKSQAEEASKEGQRVFALVEQLGIPSISAIEGPCMGGGTELSMCFQYRIASDSDKTVIAVPEIKLGFIPGWGGTYRLPKKIGLANALDMILTGKNIRPDKALKWGLVDRVAPEAIFREESLRVAQLVASGKAFPSQVKEKSLLNKIQDPTYILQSNLLGRKFIISQARKGVYKQTRGNYPAPLAALDLLEQHGDKDGLEYLKEEARVFADLWATPESKSLVGLFFLNEEAKRDTGVSLSAEKVKSLKPIQELAVLGAGVMGGGIAYQSAAKGLRTLVKDIQWESVTKALSHAEKLNSDEFKKKRISKVEQSARSARIRGQIDYSSFRSVDLVIEAVVENLDVKKMVFAELETQVRPDCLIASNTSSLRLTDMAMAFKDPSRFVGLHFFNPVHKMPLVEVVSHAGASEEAIARAVKYVKAIGKTPVVVKDGPGFLVNRILMAWLNESGYCLLEGYGIDLLDKAIKDFGMPMGPCELLDEIGLDVAAKVAKILYHDLGERSKPSDAMDRILNASKDSKVPRLGRKSGLGFYKWDKAGGRRVEADVDSIQRLLFESSVPGLPEHTKESLVQRNIFPMINEAATILEEGLTAGPSQVDLAMIYGTGFAPFRGGLCRYADSVGLDRVIAELERLAEIHGPRLAPSQSLRDLAKRQKKFYKD